MKLLFILFVISILIVDINCINNKSISEKNYYFIKVNNNNNSNNNNNNNISSNGFILTLVNPEVGAIQGKEEYVSNVEVPKKSKLNLSIITDLNKQEQQTTITQFESEIIVSGDFKDDGSNDFIISDIYHQLELNENKNNNNVNAQTIKVKEFFYFMSPSPFICNSIVNCSNIIIDKLNSNEPFGFIEKFTEPYSNSIGLLDLNWLNSRLVTNDNNYNSIVKGYQYGKNNELIISKIYINTLDPIDDCLSLYSSDKQSSKCRFGKIATFKRDLNRCPVFDKCVKKSPCHLGRPNCNKGYKLYSLPYGEKGCSKYFCDPDFLPMTTIKKF
ncbi:hypothetical protein RB653_006993 [Dictyostelium firmibasis]|uniref:Uncharacterized protein n=1 Tax=Dictyostelium firmibasis TaxID=79012 RepID=A0AAN7TMY6_9MYCE